MGRRAGLITGSPCCRRAASTYVPSNKNSSLHARTGSSRKFVTSSGLHRAVFAKQPAHEHRTRDIRSIHYSEDQVSLQLYMPLHTSADLLLPIKLSKTGMQAPIVLPAPHNKTIVYSSVSTSHSNTSLSSALPDVLCFPCLMASLIWTCTPNRERL